MLDAERDHMISEFYRMGWSLSEIARHTARDRKTVLRVLAEPLLRSTKTWVRANPSTVYLRRRLNEEAYNPS